MQAQQHPVYQLEDIKVWKAMGGAGLHIPAAGSAVYYYPHEHAAACQVQLHQQAALPNQITATVTAVHLRTTGIDVFAEFELLCHYPYDPPISLAGTELEGMADDQVDVFTKRLTENDAYRKSTCPISATLVHRRTANNRHYLGGFNSWTGFRQNHHATTNDLLVITRRLNDQYRIGLRRGPAQSSRPTAQEMQAVVTAYNNRNPLRVRYYPNVSAEYVVLASAVENAPALQPGMAVRFAGEGDHGGPVVRQGVVGYVENNGRVRILSNGKLFSVQTWKVRVVHNNN